jgi:tripartite-type tricarboxylate transporter receptor subunit TctC
LQDDSPAPDGYTIYAASTSLVINPALQSQVQYDPKKDFAPVSLLAVTPFLLQVKQHGEFRRGCRETISRRSCFARAPG